MIAQCTGAAAATLCAFAAFVYIAGKLSPEPLAQQIALKVLLGAAAIVAMWLWPTRSEADWALRPAPAVRWKRIAAGAMALGAAASILVLATGGRGLQAALGTTGLAQTVLVLWILSSLSEELVTRGWLQGLLHRWRERRIGSIAVPALVSGIVFGAMHLGLYFKNVDAATASIVVAFATVLGMWAGRLRDRFGSLIPPVVAHALFNVGGAIGGVLFVVAYRVLTGHLPPQLLR